MDSQGDIDQGHAMEPLPMMIVNVKTVYAESGVSKKLWSPP